MENKKVDLTRLNRHARRVNGAIIGEKIPGRNLPFVKKIHGTVENYNNIRKEEIEKEMSVFANLTPKDTDEAGVLTEQKLMEAVNKIDGN